MPGHRLLKMIVALLFGSFVAMAQAQAQSPLQLQVLRATTIHDIVITVGERTR